MQEKIGIIGCGWLGMPLAAALTQAGAQVWGTGRRVEHLAAISATGARAVSLSLDGASPLPPLPADTRQLVYLLPPGRTDAPGLHAARLRQVLETWAPAGHHLILVSSTGVYPSALNRPLTEADAAPHSPQAQTLLEAEALATTFPGLHCTVLRLAGLIGGDRHPVRHLAGKTALPGPDTPVNLIHRDDCVGILTALLHLPPATRILHAAAPQHPSRRAFYTAEAAHLGLPAPQFEAQGGQPLRYLDCSRLQATLTWTWQHPWPGLSSPA